VDAQRHRGGATAQFKPEVQLMTEIFDAQAGEHQLILYCKAHPELKIIQAIDILLKSEGRR
jgi:hypothetical protein